MVESDIRSIRDLSINVNDNCNLNCQYCFYKQKSGKGMNKKTARVVINWIIENIVPESTISFFGIEPMMNWKIVELMAKQLCEYKLDMTTNATLIDEKRAKAIAALDIDVLASWDGLPGVHNPYRDNSYVDTVKGIKWLNEFGISPGIASTVLPETIIYMKDNFQHIVEIAKVKFVHFNIVRNWEETWQWAMVENEWNRLYRYVIDSPIPEGFFAKWMEWRKKDKRMQRRCAAGRGIIGIDWQGYVWPCHRTNHWEKPMGYIEGPIEMVEGLICNTCDMCTTRLCHVCWVDKPNSISCRMIKIRERVLERFWSELNGS